MRQYASLKKGFLALLVLLVCITPLPGCKKIAEKVFSGFDLTLPSIPTGIPTVPISNYTYSVYRTWPFNLDSIVKAESNGTFDGSDIRSVRLKQATFRIHNADSIANLSNLQSVSLKLYSDTVRIATTLASATISDTATNTLQFDVSNSPEILPYLKGTTITYFVTFTTRRPIWHPLEAYSDMALTIK